MKKNCEINDIIVIYLNNHIRWSPYEDNQFSRELPLVF